MDNYTTIPLITFVPFFHSIGFLSTCNFYNSFLQISLFKTQFFQFDPSSTTIIIFTHFYSFYKSLTIFIQKSIFNSSFFTRYYHYTILSSILFTRLYFTRLYFIYYFHKAKLHLRKNLLPNSSLVCRKISSPRR